jgi:hypothetical protein
VSDEPPDLWSDLFEAGDSLADRVRTLRDLCRAADRDPVALELLAGMLPAVDMLLTDVLKALGERN